MAKNEFTSQHAINQAAAQAHFEAYCSALQAGRTPAQAMQLAEVARLEVNKAGAR